MSEPQQGNRLPVVDPDGALVGIVTRADVVRAFTRSDEEIRDEIAQDVLQRVFWLQPTDVAVSVEQGAVVLSGTVESESDVRLLPELVSRVPGVVSVDSSVTAR